MSTKSTTNHVESLSVKHRRLAASLYQWEGLLQSHFHDNVEAQTVMFFLHLASQAEPVDMTSVGKSLELSKASTSRNFYRLSVGIRGGAEGLDLIQYQDDPMDIRRKLLVLTPKGKQVAEELNNFIFNAVERINNHVSKE